MAKSVKYKRVLLKLSGEGLMGDKEFGLDAPTVERIAGEIKVVHDMGVELSLVIGAGNIFRGVSTAAGNIERTSADYMGMLATVMNALAMQSALEAIGISTRVQSAIPMDMVCEQFIRRRAIRHLEKGRVVIFSAGLGSPYFTTDTASALRALEIGADVIFKATKVDGAYSADPIKDKSAKKFTMISHEDVIKKGLQVMDTTAFTLCKENKMPIVIFNLKKKSNLKNAVLGLDVGTKIF